MNTRGMILLTLAVVALGLYFIGFTTGAVAVVVLAAAMELLFWIKLLDKEEQPETNRRE